MDLIVAAALGALCMAIMLTVTKQLDGGGTISSRMEEPAIRFKKVLLRTFHAQPKERRRVVVNGPKVKPVICQICLGRVKEGLEYARCECGKEFHPACLVRAASCPYCGAVYSEEILSEERMVRPRNDRTKSASTAVSMIWESKEGRTCPLCRAELPQGTNECACGAVIVDEGEDFDCPSCGTRVPADRTECPICRERFDIQPSGSCPVCGNAVALGSTSCECGALLGDACPECGAVLGIEDSYCGQCGAHFEFV
ncbi:MAG: hypothetical protein ABR879_07320 [Methanomassiliicoccales archaeon]